MDRAQWKSAARAALSDAAYPPWKLFLIHGGVTVALSLLVSVLSTVLDRSFSVTGGISGLEAQAALSTAQTVLQLLQTVAAPFWSAGILFGALLIGKGENATPATLLEGFRRFRPILSSTLLRGIHYAALGFFSMFLGTQLFMMTPFAAPLYEAVLSGEASVDVEAVFASQPEVMLGYVLVTGVVFAIAALPIWYRYRMVDWLILDHEDMGGMKAMFLSQLMTRRRKLALVRLDLSFWWYYVLQGVGIAVSLGELILGFAGISVSGWQRWLFPIVGYSIQLAVRVWAGPMVEVTFANCYRQYLQSEPEPEPQPDFPQPHPWEY